MRPLLSLRDSDMNDNSAGVITCCCSARGKRGGRDMPNESATASKYYAIFISLSSTAW